MKCESCGKRAKLGLASNLLTSHVKDVPVSEKTRKLFERVFGKAKAAGIRTTKDVDACFRDVARRYPHLMPGYKRGERYDVRSDSDMRRLGHPGEMTRDPFPTEQITDRGDLHPERRMM